MKPLFQPTFYKKKKKEDGRVVISKAKVKIKKRVKDLLNLLGLTVFQVSLIKKYER